MSVQYCKLFMHTKGCDNPDGIALAARGFGMDIAAVEAAAGRFTKGKRKGELRGWIVYFECTVGGWCKPLGRVIRPGIKFGHFAATWDDLSRLSSLSTDRFIAGAKRIDHAYGHDPLAAKTPLQIRCEEQTAYQDKTKRQENRQAAAGFLKHYKNDPSFSQRGTGARKAIATAARMLRNGTATSSAQMAVA